MGKLKRLLGGGRRRGGGRGGAGGPEETFPVFETQDQAFRPDEFPAPS